MTTKGQPWDDPQSAVEVLKAEQERMLNAPEYPSSTPDLGGPRLPPLSGTFVRVWQMPATEEVVRAGAKLQAENEWLQELYREVRIEAAREVGRRIADEIMNPTPHHFPSLAPHFVSPSPNPATPAPKLPPSIAAGEPLILPWFARLNDRKKK